MSRTWSAGSRSWWSHYGQGTLPLPYQATRNHVEHWSPPPGQHRPLVRSVKGTTISAVLEAAEDIHESTASKRDHWGTESASSGDGHNYHTQWKCLEADSIDPSGGADGWVSSMWGHLDQRRTWWVDGCSERIQPQQTKLLDRRHSTSVPSPSPTWPVV